MRRVALGVALVIAAVMALPGLALAHARYDHSTPSPGQVLSTSTPSVDIYTAQDMRKVAGADVITVVGPDGKQVDTDNTVVDDSSRRHLSVGLQPNLPPGRYVVSFKTLSDQDGEADHGQFAFYVETPPTSEQQAADAKLQLSAGTDTPDAQPVSHTGLYLGVALGAAAVVVLGCGALVWFRRRAAAPAGRQ